MKKAAVLLLAVLLAAGMARAQVSLDCHFAPGWEPSGPVRQYTAENLYEYKDGGADGWSGRETGQSGSGSDGETPKSHPTWAGAESLNFNSGNHGC